MRILVIEDEEKTAAYLRKGLTEQGFVVDVCEQGDKGSFTARSSGYDLIVLDVMLFGDANGDGGVSNKELQQFRKAIGKMSGQQGYLWYFDYDGLNGVDKTVDQVEFNKRLGTKI